MLAARPRRASQLRAQGSAGTTTIVSEKDFANPSGGQTSGQTAHQVFDIRKADGTGVLTITCNEAFWTNASLVGEEDESTITTVDFRGSAASPNCTFAGQTTSVSSGNCEFIFAANGKVHIEDDGFQGAGNHCKHGEKPITFENAVLGCKVEIGEQTIEGVEYHNIEVGGKGAVTLVANNLAVQYNAAGVGCSYGTTSNGLFTTGNGILRGERGGSAVDIGWDAEGGPPS